MPRIRFTLVKSRIKIYDPSNRRSLDVKWRGAGFHSIAKLCAQNFNPGLAGRDVYSADCHNENGRTADCQSQESELEGGLPQA
jgi:hypothetical protein